MVQMTDAPKKKCHEDTDLRCGTVGLSSCAGSIPATTTFETELLSRCWTTNSKQGSVLTNFRQQKRRLSLFLMFKKHEKFNTFSERVEKMAIFGYEFYLTAI